MKKITLLLAFSCMFNFFKAQGLQAIVVEKYYLSNAADSTNAADNAAVSDLHRGSITYRVFVDMAPGYEFTQIFGNQDPQGVVIHPLVIKTTTNFYNDPTFGQVFPQSVSVNNTRKNTTLIDSWLSVGGVCAGKMGVLKTEDTDGSIGNANGALTNNPGGIYGVAINSVVSGAQDGMMPGTPLAPTNLGLGSAIDIFDQTPGGTFSVTNGALAGLGGVVGITPSNMVLIGQFTTNGVLCFSLNVQVTNTVTNVGEVYVPGNVQAGETLFAGLSYCSNSNTTTTGIETIAFTSEEPFISLFPNPAGSEVTLQISNLKNSSNNSYSVYDVNGRLIQTSSLGNSTSEFSETINTSGLSSGIYMVTLVNAGKISTKKFIKE